MTTSRQNINGSKLSGDQSQYKILKSVKIIRWPTLMWNLNGSKLLADQP